MKIFSTTNPKITVPVFIVGLMVIAYGVYRLGYIEEKYAEIIAAEKNVSNVILNVEPTVICKNRKTGYEFKAKNNVSKTQVKGKVCCTSGFVSYGASCSFH